MRKLLILSVLFLYATIYVHAQTISQVTLDDEQRKKQTIKEDLFNIFLTKEDTDDEGISNVKVEIENKDDKDEYCLILFDRAYKEKDLKALDISFVKGFPGKDIDPCKEMRRKDKPITIKPNETITLTEIQITEGKKDKCLLPIYIAKYKNKSKRKLLLLEKKPLVIEVEVKQDMDIIKFEQAYEDLMKDIEKETFCTNPRHTPTLKNKEILYRERITRIQSEISDFFTNRNIFNKERQSPKYKRYNELSRKLSSIDLTQYETDCGKHSRPEPKPIPKCKYCNLTPQQIYNKLNDYYTKISNSSDRKATKNAVMADVNLLYNCRKHSAAWKKSDYQKKINDRYKRICDF